MAAQTARCPPVSSLRGHFLSTGLHCANRLCGNNIALSPDHLWRVTLPSAFNQPADAASFCFFETYHQSSHEMDTSPPGCLSDGHASWLFPFTRNTGLITYKTG
jgi:hypothetical protein